MWESIVISLLVSTAISFLLSPKPSNSPTSTVEEFSVPETKDGEEIPIIFGTVIIESANVASYMDMSIEPIEKEAGGK